MLTTVLIGDSIRRGYHTLVAGKLEGRVKVVGPWENCRHSLWALDHYQQWVGNEMAEIVHVNFGLHDTGIQADGSRQIVQEQYKLCAGRFFAHAKDAMTTMIWATTTPRYFAKPGVPKADWEKDRAVEEYNAVAIEQAEANGLRVNDLHQVVLDNDFTKCLGDDGVHMTPHGYEVLAQAVADAIVAAVHAVPGHAND